jgi:hypothetical protein
MHVFLVSCDKCVNITCIGCTGLPPGAWLWKRMTTPKRDFASPIWLGLAQCEGRSKWFATLLWSQSSSFLYSLMCFWKAKWSQSHSTFSGSTVIKWFLKMLNFLEIICLNCQTLRKSQSRVKYKNWWKPRRLL